MNEEKQIEKQLKRESDCHDAGYQKFLKNEREMMQQSNGSNTTYAVWLKSHFIPDVVAEMKATLQDLRNTRASKARKVIEECLMGGKSSGDFQTHGFWDIYEAAFAGFQMTLDCALNPNIMDSTVPGRYGGDKKLLAKKTISQNLKNTLVKH